MGQAISSTTQMILTAGDFRRDAREAAHPELAAKLKMAAANLETAAIAQVSAKDPMVGTLLDTLA